MAETRRDCVTLASVLGLLQDEDNAFILCHGNPRYGPCEYEAAAGGTARSLRAARCMKECGDNVVEKLWLEADDWPEVWPESNGAAPVLVIVVGGKEAEA